MGIRGLVVKRARGVKIKKPIARPDFSRAKLEIRSDGGSSFIALDELPMPPTGNHQYIMRRTKSGRQFRTLSTESRLWSGGMATWALTQRDLPRVRELLKDWTVAHRKTLYCVVNFGWPASRVWTQKQMPKRIDQTNFVKIIHDSVAELLEIDDSWFFSCSQNKTELADDGPPLVWITVGRRFRE